MKVFDRAILRFLLAGCLATAIPASAVCPNPGGDGEERTPGTPIVLDLNGDGINTTSIYEPVRFDLDADGDPELIAWTNYDTWEGFLWRDLDGNRRVTDGSELFGDAMQLWDGSRAQHGFEALRELDDRYFGGNEDGWITPADRVWPELGVWVDRNGDGFSQLDELHPLEHFKVVAIALDFIETTELDGNLNWHRYRGRFLLRVPGKENRGEPVIRDLIDVVFDRVWD